MTILTKALLGTGAAAAALVMTASPAMARDRDGIDVGDIIAGAVIIGGIAAVVGAIGDDDRYDRGYSYGNPYDPYGRQGYNNGYNYRSGNPRQAVELCVRTAENAARRYSYGRADVTQIRDIDRNSRGYTVRGRIAVDGQGRDWRGWNSNRRSYDSGSFKCKVQYGRVVDLDFDGIRGI